MDLNRLSLNQISLCKFCLTPLVLKEKHMPDIESQMMRLSQTLDQHLSQYLTSYEIHHAKLQEAMSYASIGSGKRLRPFLLYEISRMLGVSEQRIWPVACAIELVHCYSLVHDDLPAMDDDDMRRGKKSLHKAYDEATAILTGDALLTLAFQILSQSDDVIPADIRLKLIHDLTLYAGARGMIAGQMLDLFPEKSPKLEDILKLQKYKTGALIEYACRAGTLLGSADHQDTKIILDYASRIGLLFQMVDDILDIIGDEEKLGKKVGKDAKQGKVTLISLLGLEQAQKQALKLGYESACSIETLEKPSILLKELPNYLLHAIR